MKKSLLLLALTLVCNLSFAQIDNQLKIENYTIPDEIEIIVESEITEEMKKVGTVFAKAKGVTTIAAINNVNNRALRKLKTEASMRGGSHILVTQETQENTVFSKTSAYSAIIYRSNQSNVNEIKELLESKEFSYRFERKYNRNKFDHKDKLFNQLLNQPLQKNQLNPPYVKNGKIILEIMEFIGNRNRLIKYEVIANSDSQILLFKEEIPGKEMKMIILEKVK
ncbi:hypothetical protein [Aquiflexum sp.]|uniref:hypothetical protein n=1 Tax=Aquiflexum sp. TaxID=1872584 RepID=UPI0035930B90